jgi:hypothetical protein
MDWSSTGEVRHLRYENALRKSMLRGELTRLVKAVTMSTG